MELLNLSAFLLYDPANFCVRDNELFLPHTSLTKTIIVILYVVGCLFILQ